MERLGIAGVFLFGSQAQGLARETSDYDFGILIKDYKVLSDTSQKNSIYDRLYDLFSSQIQKLVNIDIVFLQSADLQLQYHVVSSGNLLYLGDASIVSDFIERTIEFYADFAPHRKIFHESILGRI
ncbi:MAG: nucleotidyltransferase domain-containing protein [Deltaproteobacteria bacterium]|nr:nucleotidyltransferase domain-containing protein [Deltaproteobacteria bacterium]